MIKETRIPFWLKDTRYIIWGPGSVSLSLLSVSLSAHGRMDFLCPLPLSWLCPMDYEMRVKSVISRWQHEEPGHHWPCPVSAMVPPVLQIGAALSVLDLSSGLRMTLTQSSQPTCDGHVVWRQINRWCVKSLRSAIAFPQHKQAHPDWYTASVYLGQAPYLPWTWHPYLKRWG